MSAAFPGPGAIANHVTLWIEGSPRPLHYRRTEPEKWVAVDEYGAPRPRSDAFPADELITILADAIPHEQDPMARRAAQAQAAARDFARALNEMLNAEQPPDWWHLASEALARHPQYSA